MSRTRGEKETIIRYDETDEPAYLWTASPVQARRWTRLGLAVVREPGGWIARAPLDQWRIGPFKLRTPAYKPEIREKFRQALGMLALIEERANLNRG
jgi:hypothetical protein